MRIIMFYDNGLFGMHMFWWFFWLILLVSFFSFSMPVSRKKARLNRLTPLDILQRRYAVGELATGLRRTQDSART